ncbi:hypothetical protein WT27_12810 [Burkholderia territorii]|uniref:DUF1738 domain-containing protein n=2 Tax=Burkholderia territorii TaxID=1503055 RepID=A0A125A9A8_9BURK|nr:hypothetical protein WT27_12810 [Burkholderia territorii]
MKLNTLGTTFTRAHAHPKENVMEQRQSAAHKLAEQLYAAMEQGVAPWQKPWDASGAGASAMRPRNYTSGRRYRGGNLFALAIVASENGWGGDWMSSNEAKRLGGHVRDSEKGKGTLIIRPMVLKDKAGDSAGGEAPERGEEKQKKPRMFFVSHFVYNEAQIDGLPVREQARSIEIPTIESAEAILQAMREDGMGYNEPSPDGRAYYRPSTDSTSMPARSTFASQYDFYATLMHELGHATMGKDRVARNATHYATEELRAEMAATLTCAELGLPRLEGQLENHAAYLQSWLREFADKKHKLVSVASDAQRIADWLIERAGSKVVARDDEMAVG